MGTNYIAPIWRMPENTNKDKLSNYSISLSSGTDYISMGSVPNLFIGSWSISFWFKAPSVGNTNGTIISRYRSANATGDLEITSTSGQIYVETGGGFPSTGAGAGTNQIRTTSTSLDDGNWHHIAFSLDYTSGTSTRSLYVDGSLDVSDSTTTPAEWVSQTDNLLFGILIPPSNSPYNGSINQVSIFDYTFDSDQVAYLYGLNNPMVISGGEPVAYYPLGDNSNPNATAGYPNTSVGADSVFEFSTQDNIESPHIDMTGAMSISGWFKTTDTGYNMIYHEDLQIRTGGNRNWFFTTQGNLLRFSQFYNNGTFDNVSSSGITVNDGNWHHGVFVWDGTTNVDSMKIFVDGILRGKTTASSTNRNNHNVTGMIGSSNVNYNMIGELSNIQIWDANLTYGTASNLEDVAGGQVAELYNNGQPLMSGTQPQETNLKAWYKLNQYDSYWDLGGNGKWTFNNAAIN